MPVYVGSAAMSPTRLLSLDVFRGATVAAMVLVNNPGTWRAVYPPLRHAAWHGVTPTDAIFPFFLFIVGVAIPLALAPRLADANRAAVLVKIVRRSVVIFALGLFLHAVPSFQWETLRIPGVLQRIAVCYLLAALLFMITTWRAQLVVTAALLLSYWGAMTLIPVPSYGAGDLSPAGNLAAYVDREVLGAHVWRVDPRYDPEGILSTVPALATTLIGVVAGQWLRSGRAPRTVAAGLALAGVGGVVVGFLWSLSFPLNKALWTSSYAVFMTGVALIVLAACYWLIDIRGYRRWATPFAILGVNALVLFFLSSLVARLLGLIRVGAAGANLHTVLFDHLFAPWAAPVQASLAYALAYVVVWWALMWILYRRHIVLRV
jgi:predicted acyltransferase